MAWKSSSWLLSVKMFPYSINNNYEYVYIAASICKMLYPWIHILITHRKLFLYPKLAPFVCLTHFQSDHDYSKLNEYFAQAHFILWMAGNCVIAVSFTAYSAFAFQNQSTFDWTNKSLVYLCNAMFLKKKKKRQIILNWKLTFHNYHTIFRYCSLLGQLSQL